MFTIKYGLHVQSPLRIRHTNGALVKFMFKEVKSPWVTNLVPFCIVKRSKCTWTHYEIGDEAKGSGYQKPANTALWIRDNNSCNLQIPFK